MRIGITGSSSVGKSTLVRELAKLPEFKTYKIFTEKSKELQSIGVPLDKNSTFEGQLIFSAERAKELLFEYMISDRSIIDVQSYSLSSDKINFKQERVLFNIFINLLSKYDVIIYIPPFLPLINNSLRSLDEVHRTNIDKNIRRLLKYYNGKIIYLSAINLQDRVKVVLDELKEELR